MFDHTTDLKLLGKITLSQSKKNVLKSFASYQMNDHFKKLFMTPVCKLETKRERERPFKTIQV